MPDATEAGSVFSTTSDPSLRLALGFGLAALLATLALVLQVLAMRWRAQRRARRRRALQDLWRPCMMKAALNDGAGAAGGSVADAPAPLPRGAELIDWLLLWNQLQDSLRGGAHAGLNRIAELLDVPAAARRLAASRATSRRVLGLLTLGHLRRREDAALLRAALRAPQPVVGLAAARALMQADADGAAPVVLARYLERDDWPVARMGTLLRMAGAEAVEPLLQAALRADDEGPLLKLLPLLPFVQSPRSDGALRDLVARSESPRVLSLALRQLADPAALPQVRERTSHPDALVRSAAAQALGRLGQPADREPLLTLLQDRDWWVRHRAAQALLALPSLGESLDQAVAALGDPFATDMLAQVRAERTLAAAPARPA